MDTGHWETTFEFDINEWHGFIYRIIEKSTGREYIGKKNFFSERTRRLPNRKNKQHYKMESNWRVYTSSSTSLNEQISKNGIDNYRFKIESLHQTKASLTYREVEVQITENVLREKLPDKKTPKFYNKRIDGVKFIPLDPTDKELKFRS